MLHPWQICVPVFFCELQSCFLILINLLLTDMTDKIYISFGSCWFQYWWWSLAYIQVTKGVQCPRKITTFVSVSVILWNIISVYQMLNIQTAYRIREFYTGWLTHWGEKIATTDADFTAAALEKILQKNGSAVLYVCLNLYLFTVWKSHSEQSSWFGFSNFQMAHGGTNFGFYNGANTGVDEADYKPDLTSYDYVRNLLTLMLNVP